MIFLKCINNNNNSESAKIACNQKVQDTVSPDSDQTFYNQQTYVNSKACETLVII